MKIRIFILTFLTLISSTLFADPIYVRQPDGTIQKIEILDAAATQAAIDALNANISQIQTNMIQTITSRSDALFLANNFAMAYNLDAPRQATVRLRNHRYIVTIQVVRDGVTRRKIIYSREF